MENTTISATTSILGIMDSVNEEIRSNHLSGLKPFPTGFEPLDRFLGGGFKQGELVIVTGAQGVGKTTMAFQMARNIAARGAARCLYLCYEHEPQYLLTRLISLESLGNGFAQIENGLTQNELRKRILQESTESGLYGILENAPSANVALAKIRSYGDRLHIVKGSGLHTDLDAITGLVKEYKAMSSLPLVLFVDYLQKIPVYPEPAEENEKVTKVGEGLKEIALSEEVAIVTIGAADKEGLQAKRLNLYHLRGSSALAYEADIVLVLNDKYHIVSKSNIEFNPHKAQAFRDWIVCSIEKNRSGVDSIDLQFRKRFEFCCFDPEGDTVSEKLIEGRLYTE